MTSRRKYNSSDSQRMYDSYYMTQAGNGLPVFEGSRNQRGHGFGSILGGLFRSALPMLKRVGGQILRGGAGVLSDVLDGQNFQDSAKRRTSQGLKTLIGENNDIPQQGGGVSRRRKRGRSIKRKKATGQKRTVARKKSRGRKRARDIFS